VAASDEAGERKPDHTVLTDDDAMDVALDLFEELGRAPRLEGLFLGGRHRAPV